MLVMIGKFNNEDARYFVLVKKILCVLWDMYTMVNALHS